MQKSGAEKDRLENNQRARKKLNKEQLNIKEGKDEEWYNPLWFEKKAHPELTTIDNYYAFLESNRDGKNYW